MNDIFPKRIKYDYTVPPEYEGTVCDYLKESHKYSSRVITGVKHEGRLLVNGEDALFITKVRGGDKVCVIFPQEKSLLEASGIPLDIIYEDADILIINKQAGVVVHPTKSHAEDTVANAVAKHWQDNGFFSKPRFVNRIDMDTTGIVVCAKNKYVHHVIQSEFMSGGGTKKYIALVKGAPPDDEGVIDANMARIEPYALERVVTEDGDRAITRYKVLKRLRGYSLVSLRLYTGRTHQIRVHMKYIGCPIAGDRLYSDDRLLERQALHACYISFTHPRTGESVEFFAPTPRDIQRAAEELAEN